MNREGKQKVKKQLDDLLGKAPRNYPKGRKRATTKATPEQPAPNAPLQKGFMLRGKFVPEYPTELATIEAGFKTPEVREWYKQHHPDIYNHIYPVKG